MKIPKFEFKMQRLGFLAVPPLTLTEKNLGLTG